MDTEVYFESFAGACLPSAGLGSFLNDWKIQQLLYHGLLVCQDILQDVVNQRKFWSNLLSNTFSQTAEPQTGSLQESLNHFKPLPELVRANLSPCFPTKNQLHLHSFSGFSWRKEMRPISHQGTLWMITRLPGKHRWCRWWVGNDSVSFPRPSDLLQNERPWSWAVLPGVHLCNMCILVAL